MTREFSAPLHGVTSGCLRFPSGGAELALGVDPKSGDLYRARFEEPVPTVEAQRGMVVVRYHQRHACGTGARPSELALNGSIPWDIEFLGGAANITADLRGLELASVTLDGGVSEVLVNLPHPRGTISVRASGGANEVTLVRPAGVPVGVQVLGGGRYLSLDDQYFGAVGGETKWASAGYANAADRYDIVVSGGAHALTLEAR